MQYFQHKNYGLCVKLENTEEMRGFSDKLIKWQQQLNTAEHIRLDSVLLQLAPPKPQLVRWYRRVWNKIASLFKSAGGRTHG